MLDDRFTSKFVVTADGCWLWTAAKDRRGYGVYQHPRAEARAQGIKRRVAAHRFAYESEVGPIPDGFHIDHLCRTPSCVNPAHLEAVTPRENWRRGAGLGCELWDGTIPETHTTVQQSRKTHCVNGHEFTPENTTWEGPDRKHRRCKTCQKARSRKANLRRRVHEQWPLDECSNGHPYTPENTRESIEKNGQRRRTCRACAAAGARRYKQRQQQAG